MRNARWWQLLCSMRTLSLILLMLAGCGGNSGTNERGGDPSASSTSQLIIRLLPPPSASSGTAARRDPAAQTRQIPTGSVVVRAFNGATEIDNVTCNLPNPDPVRCPSVTEVPAGIDLTIVLRVPRAQSVRITVSVNDSRGVELFRGATQVITTQAREVVTITLEAITVSSPPGSPPPGSPPPGSNTPPRANAGREQTVSVGQMVFLRGDSSTDLDGDQLTFDWAMTSAPAESLATLADSTMVNPTFVPDRPGAYVLMLVVSDGQTSGAPDTVTINVGDESRPANSTPVADTAFDQRVEVGTSVLLRGAGSSDVDGNRLTFSWFLAGPQNSTAALSDPHSVIPSFVADQPGLYSATLIINDGMTDSKPATVLVSTTDPAPAVAAAGVDQTVQVGGLVALDGAASFDADGNALTFRWALIVRPDGSNATLIDAATQTPSFIVDVPGTYVAQLIVNNGTTDSEPDTVTLSTGNSFPMADAGQSQQGQAGTLVMLNGRNSFDPDRDPLFLFWALTVLPPGSDARLDDPHALTPTFLPDIPGNYVVQLIVEEALRDSAPATALISARGVLSLPTTLTVAPGQVMSLPVSIGPGTAPEGGVVVTLVSNDTNLVRVGTDVQGCRNNAGTATILIPQGAAAVNAQACGIGTGMATITANHPMYTSGMSQVTSDGRLHIVRGSESLSASFATDISISMETSRNTIFAAPAGGVPVTLSAADPTCVTIPSSAVILPGRIDVLAMLAAGTAGPCTTQVTVSAPHLTPSIFNVTVDPVPGISTSTELTVGTGGLEFVAIFLGTANHGGTTVHIESNAPGMALVAPDDSTPGSPALDLFVPHGSTFASYSIQGVGAGQATVDVSAPGFVMARTMVNVVQSTISVFGPPFTVGENLQETFFFQLDAAHHGGTLVQITSSDPTIMQVSPGNAAGMQSLSLALDNGDDAGEFTLQGLTPGQVMLTVSAPPHFAPVTVPVDVVEGAFALQSQNNAFRFDSIAGSQPFQVVVGIRDPHTYAFTAAQPVRFGGQPFIATIINHNTEIAQLQAGEQSPGQTVTTEIPAGSSTGFVQFLPLHPGTTSVMVERVENADEQTLTAANEATQQVVIDSPHITITPVTVGEGLQTSGQFVQLSGAFHDGTNITLHSDAPNLALLSLNAATPGSASIQLPPIPHGSRSSVAFFVQGLAVGQTTLRADDSEERFNMDPAMIDVVQPVVGFNAVSSSVTPFTTNVALTASIGVPNPATGFLLPQTVRPDIPMPPVVTFTNSDSTVAQFVMTAGTGQSAMLTIPVGQAGTPTGAARGGVDLDVLGSGVTIVDSTISGFLPASLVNSRTPQTITSNQPSISPFPSSTTVGVDLQTFQQNVQLGVSNHGGVTVQVSSSDPNIALVAPDTLTAGTPSVNLPVANNRLNASYVVHGVAPGTAMLTFTAPGFATANSPVTVVPAAFLLGNIVTSSPTLAPPTSLQVFIGALNTANNSLLNTQSLRVGANPRAVTFTNGNNLVGQLLVGQGSQAPPRPVGQQASSSIMPGMGGIPEFPATSGVSFDPFAEGMTTLSVDIPGFTSTAQAQHTFHVAAPAITLSTRSTTVGAGLQTGSFTVSLGFPHHGGVTLRLASSDPNVALVSRNATEAGSAFVDLMIPDGRTVTSYFVQGVEGSMGSVLITASAPGFLDAVSVVNVVQPAVFLDGLSRIVSIPRATAPPTLEPFQVTVGITRDDQSALQDFQGARAGGPPLVATITSSDIAVAVLETATSMGATATVEIPTGDAISPFGITAGGVQLRALRPGRTTIRVTIPGFLDPGGATQQVEVQDED